MKKIVLGQIDDLNKKSKWVRNRVLEMCLSVGGHLVSSFSCVDIIVALYYGGILHYDPKRPEIEDRDRFILSKGHAAPTIYAVLADLGFFPMEELARYSCGGGILGAHPDKVIPGVEVTTGSLGHGLGLAAGMALAAQIDKKSYMNVVLMGDGECSEGSIWESALFASHNQLSNLIAIIDHNKLCVTDFTRNCIGLDPLQDKWEAFGWDVVNVDGHSFCDLLDVFRGFRFRKANRPLMVIADTVKGKGVSFMENDPFWHTRIPTGEQIESAKRELSS
ncbi:MAG: transketolase [Candidatus Omnitrophica bacterium]|nr:transketolase [Candidatus Omnitrophota bacterium]